MDALCWCIGRGVVYVCILHDALWFISSLLESGMNRNLIIVRLLFIVYPLFIPQCICIFTMHLAIHKILPSTCIDFVTTVHSVNCVHNRLYIEMD